MRSLAILPLLFLTGCPKGSLPVDISKFSPKLQFENFELDGINFQQADTQFVFNIDNPNPIGLSVASFTYDLDLAGNGFLEGTNADGLALPATGSAQFKLPVTVVFADVIDLVQNIDVKNEVPFAIQGEFGFQTPLGILRIPYQEEGMLPVLQPPKITVKGIRVDTFQPLRNRATLAVDIGVTSTGGSELSLAGFDYDLTLGGESVATGLLHTFADVSGDAEQVVTLPIDLNLLGMGTSIVSAISSRGPLDVGLTGGLTVSTPFGPLPLTIDEQTNLNLR
jgi:LEA14-like dessication related protein